MILRLIIKFLRDEYESIPKDQFLARMNRYSYYFEKDITWDIDFKEWRELENSDGEKNERFVVVNPGLANVLHTNYNLWLRQKQFKKFLGLIATATDFDSIITIFQQYPQTFILQ
jgi:hypothetical protein